MVLVVWQGVRNGKSQSAFSAKIASLTSDLGQTKQQVVEAYRDQQTEVARRQQAEKDLAIIVQASGRATREGVVSDIKKSPIKVEVSGTAEAAPLQTEDVRIVQSIVRSSHSDAQYAAQWVIQPNVPINTLRRIITCNVPLKYKEWRPASGVLSFSSGGLDSVRIYPPDPTKLVIDLMNLPGLPVLSPEQALLIFVYSEAGPIKIKSIEVGPK